MTVQELAAQLDGSEYPLRIPAHTVKAAHAAGLLIVYGASDDLCEFQGAFEDEAGCYNGGTISIDREGIIPDFANVEHEVGEVEKWVRRNKSAAKIEALWCAEPGFSWTYKTELPHVDFLVMEDGDPYCRGMVIDITTLPPKVAS